jgi:hypothetical protein
MLAITHVLQKTQINRLGAVHDGDLSGLRNNGAHLRRDAVGLAQEQPDAIAIRDRGRFA